MRRSLRGSLFLFALLGAGCASTVPDDGYVYLDQGWSTADRQWFYSTTQGSQLIRYDWFLALEQPGRDKLFRSNDNVERYRYLTNVASRRYNPDGLPVGFSRHDDPATGAWVGQTCAACHTAQIDYGDAQIRIDGGPALADYMSFHDDLIDALAETWEDDAKFGRFAERVLGAQAQMESAEELREELLVRLAELRAWQARSHAPLDPGYARVDAFGIILNEVSGTALGLPGNIEPPDAPVSYPFLWDTPQHDFVQWNGIAKNGTLGSLGRNVGEVLGVFGRLRLKKSRFGYASSVETGNLRDMEDRIKKLTSPKWPEEHLTPIDWEMATAGKQHYDQHCKGCHVVLSEEERTDPQRRIEAKMAKVSKLGTDPRMATNFIRRTAKTGRLKGARTRVIVGSGRLAEEEPAGAVLSHVVKGVIIRRVVDRVAGPRDTADPEATPKIPEKQLQLALAGLSPEGEDLETVAMSSDSPLVAYKARPLNGIWATAPYLHNGSVPNLYQLLLPSERRVASFTVGSRDFDPVNVGFDTAPFEGGFVFDTTLPGNSNGGHDYGTGKLTDAERWELVEYMKTL